MNKKIRLRYETKCSATFIKYCMQVTRQLFKILLPNQCVKLITIITLGNNCNEPVRYIAKTRCRTQNVRNLNKKSSKSILSMIPTRQYRLMNTCTFHCSGRWAKILELMRPKVEVPIKEIAVGVNAGKQGS